MMRKFRKYKCHVCGVIDENWNCAPWTKSDKPVHYTCGNYHHYQNTYGKMFLKTLKKGETNES
tara:strand:- start:351 stop:539 length:189 start_codon:yes stop_codon:yes gene_type:complete